MRMDLISMTPGKMNISIFRCRSSNGLRTVELQSSHRRVVVVTNELRYKKECRRSVDENMQFGEFHYFVVVHCYV